MSQPQSSGQHGAHEHEHEHVLPLQLYFKIFGALIFLTGITVVVSYLNLGPNALLVAMAVALVKASLVVGFFMHLKFDTRFNLLVLLGSLAFLVLFFLLIFIDLGTRGSVLPEQDTFYLRNERKTAERAKAKAAEFAERAAAAAKAKAKLAPSKPVAPKAKPVAPKAQPAAPKPAAPKTAAPGSPPGAPAAKPAAPQAQPGAPGTKPAPQ